ncbi:hypothetical protein NHQ30_002622 [Ciborinia camelliae]|nr:hypothetical protein NHQ30_002622 [Ciborinia camelliae]
MFNTIYTSVIPLIKEKYSDKVQIIFRQHIQPWHPSSTLVHEAGVAVLTLSPQNFYPFSASLFKQQKDFFDVNVVNETRNATYKRLAKIAGEVGVDEQKVFDLLKIGDRPAADGSLNSGNGVTNHLKVLVKMNRLVGIHVTPTVVVSTFFLLLLFVAVRFSFFFVFFLEGLWEKLDFSLRGTGRWGGEINYVF